MPKGYCPDNIKTVPIKDNIDYMRLVCIKLKDLSINPFAEEFIKILSELLNSTD